MGTHSRIVGSLVVAAAACVAGPGRRADAADAVGARISGLFAAKASKSLRVSAAVWDASTGALLASHDLTTPRRPASVAKVATTAAAFLALGPDRELETRVVAASRPEEDGFLEGDLVVRGGGDPGFASHFDPRGAEAVLRDLAKQVRAAGVRRVQGRLVLDATAYPGPARHPSWGWADGEWGWDQAPVSALVLNDDCVTVTIRPGAGVGAAGVITTAPETSAVRLVNRVTTVATRKEHSLVFGRTQADGSIPVTGGVLAGSQGFTDDQAFVDPVAFFGDVFRRLLKEEGVIVAGPTHALADPDGTRNVTADVGTGARTVARHGTRVADVARVANTRSQNLYAELLFREVGRAKLGDGSWQGGSRAVSQVLGFAEVDPQFRLADGSGYSREDQLSADAVGKVLARMWDSPHRRAYMLTFAKAGDPDGTLRRRFREAKFKDRVLAKTGTLRDTKSLAGWALGRSGRQYAFAILCEGDNGRAIELQDAVVEALVDG